MIVWIILIIAAIIISFVAGWLCCARLIKDAIRKLGDEIDIHSKTGLIQFHSYEKIEDFLNRIS